MHNYVLRRGNCIDRVHFFGTKLELVPLSPKETDLFTRLAATRTSLKSWITEQGTGNRLFRDGSFERQLLAGQLFGKLREVSDIAKSIESEGVQPGISLLFRLPSKPTYEVLIATAVGFADTAEPIAALFTDRGLPATFIADIEALVTAFEASSGVKLNGLADQTSGTAGMEALAAEGLKIIQQLRPIIAAKLRNQPALLAAWKLASRVASRGAEEPEETPEPVPTEPEPAPPVSGT